jgi:hypothetical protein
VHPEFVDVMEKEFQLKIFSVDVKSRYRPTPKDLQESLDTFQFGQGCSGLGWIGEVADDGQSFERKVIEQRCRFIHYPISHDPAGKHMNVKISLEEINNHVIEMRVKSGFPSQDGESAFPGRLEKIG